MSRASALILCLASFACAGRGRPAPPAPVFPMELVWRAALDDVIEPPLATDGTRVFVAARDGSLRALDPRDGSVLWKVGRRPGRVGAGQGLVALHRQDGTTWILDAEKGEVRQRVETGIAHGLPPVVDGDRIFIAGEGLAAIEATTGHVLWSIPSPPLVTAPPASFGPCVLVGESDGTLRCRDPATGASLWTYATGSPLLAPPVVDDHHRVLVGTTSGAFVALALDGRGGRKWRWKLGADVPGPATVFADVVLFASYENVLYALKRSNGNLVWRASLPSRPIGGPALVSGAALVACHENELLGFDARTGKRLGSFKTPAPLLTPPLLAGDHVYLGLRDRSVVALRLGVAPTPGPSAPGAREESAPTPSLAPGEPAAPATPSPTPVSDAHAGGWRSLTSVGPSVDYDVPARPAGLRTRDRSSASRIQGPRSKPILISRGAHTMSTRTFHTPLLLGALAYVACGGGETPKAEATVPPATTRAAAPAAGAGSIAGKITFEGTPPAPEKVKLAADPKCQAMHPGGTMDRQTIRVKDGGLADVFVYVKSGVSGSYPPPSEPVVLDQQGCTYHPHIITLQTSQPLKIRNSDDTLHNIHPRPAINTEFNIGQPRKGMESTKSFDKQEIMIPVRCDVHPWMSSYIAVMSHPFFAVTKEDGTYEIKGLPAGDYEVEAWHEKLKTMSGKVTVKDGEPAKLDLAYKG